MKLSANTQIDEAAVTDMLVATKLCINRRLYEKKLITEEMYARAVEVILKEGQSGARHNVASVVR